MSYVPWGRSPGRLASLGDLYLLLASISAVLFATAMLALSILFSFPGLEELEAIHQKSLAHLIP